jgi:5-methylcytosine-specific restriction enzyme A
MATNLKTLEWTEILQNNRLTNELDISIFQALYSFDGHKAYASQVGLLLGNTGKAPHGPLNLEIGRYGNRIAKEYDVKLTIREDGSIRKWDLFFNGWAEGTMYIWQLKPELVEALEQTGLTDDEKFPDEIGEQLADTLFEGLKRTIIVNSYERNPKARQLCVKHWKAICVVCDFDFEKKYGELGKGFIHVHHLTPIADIGQNYQVNPINDLRPVCPNCHSMLHRDEATLTIAELKTIIKERL